MLSSQRPQPRTGPDAMTHCSSKRRTIGLALGGWLAIAASSLAKAPSHDAPEPRPEGPDELLLDELAARGATIGRIEIIVQNVFDTSDPEESKRLYRWANRVHMT